MVAIDTEKQLHFVKGIGLALLVLVFLWIFTWLSISKDWDLRLARLFYSTGDGWIYTDRGLWRWLYEYGTIPGMVLTIGAFIIFVLGYIKQHWLSYQKSMLVIVLTAIIGAGFLVNGIIKPYCGRPRPDDLFQFGGQWDYCTPCFDSVPGKGMSFPCGHCTMGFLFVTLIYCRRRSAWLAYGGALFGISYGVLLSITRMVQGGHFLTDALWALGILLIVSVLLNFIFIPILQERLLNRRLLSSRQKSFGLICAIVLIVAMVLVFLTRRPFFEVTGVNVKLPNRVTQVVVSADVPLDKHVVRYNKNRFKVAMVGQGFGWILASEQMRVVSEVKDTTLFLQLYVTSEGYFAELRHELNLFLPASAQERVTVKVIPNSGKVVAPGS